MKFQRKIERVLEKHGFSPMRFAPQKINEYKWWGYTHTGGDLFYTVMTENGEVSIKILGEHDSKELYDQGTRYTMEMSWDNNTFYAGDNEQDFQMDFEEILDFAKK